MVAIVVGTHGDFARELVRTSEMILGEKENITSVALEPGDSADDLVAKYKRSIESLDTTDGIVFITDLFGGSPYNAACKLAITNDKIGVVAGVNLSMVLEVLTLQDASVEKIIEVAQIAGKEGIIAFNSRDIMNHEEEDL